MDNGGPYVTSTMELTRKQINRLRTVLNETVEIHGKGNFPTISARLIDIISCVREKLRQAGMPPKSVKLNGGAASHVASADDFSYADLDLIFPMEVENSDSFDKVREAVFDTIMDMIPSANKSKINADTVKDVYIGKMVKVSGDDDRWSLFSLHNDFGRCIELKFVDKMRRQFEFSVDSFQITLDSLLDDFNNQEPKIYIESVFGDVHQAMAHLQERLIDTRRPEEIRGGGLLKYCHLLIRGYKAARPSKCRQLERYMCSRFFIDFPDVVSQEQKLRNYLDNHFGSNNDQVRFCRSAPSFSLLVLRRAKNRNYPLRSEEKIFLERRIFLQWSSSGDETDSEASMSMAPSTILAQGQAKYDFLMLLHRVVSESTVCLMSHERRQTLVMIDRLAFQV
ncbi:unnamed protein product [Angiostrongylus costaricensis]|uniref:polynucleotide adenylyltransferase n=1 Tax=Angiostrongylus costaricensis TaxID=334426 RepID=A0A158PJ83_ANGCS|nr:unnamed protein product [Angiostrongylus costaricensis]